MTIPRSAPFGGASGPTSRPVGLPPLPGRSGNGPGRRPALTRAQQARLRLVSAIIVLVGVLGGLLATVILPHVYAARVSVLINLGDTSAATSLADTTLTTQALLITSPQVLGPVSARTTVPIDYLFKNVTATVVPNTNPGTVSDNVPNADVIQIQVDHPDRTSGMEIANEVAKQYLSVAGGPNNQIQAQIDGDQRQLNDPTTDPNAALDLQAQISDLQNQLSSNVRGETLPSIVGPAYSVTAPIFPNTLITLGIGALVGILGAALIGFRLVKGWTKR